MKRILFLISVLAFVFTSYGQYYQTDNNKTTKNLPTVSSMEKQKSKTAKNATTKPATTQPATTQSAPTQSNKSTSATEHQGGTVVIHDTMYITTGGNKQYEGLSNVVKNMLNNFFVEMKLSNYSASNYTMGVLKNDGYAFLAPLPDVFAGQKNYVNSKDCYDNLEKVEYRRLNQSNYQKLEKSFVSSNYANDFLMVTTPDNKMGGGVRIESPSGRVKGWMFWFYKNSNNDPMDFEVEPLEIDFRTATQSVKQPAAPNVKAGAFVQFYTDKSGDLGATLYAMAKKNNGKWELVKVQNANGTASSGTVNNNPSPTPTSTSTSTPTPAPTPASTPSSSSRGDDRGGERGGGGR